jgi:uncharacterized protein YqgC (DUF456 family)
MWVIVKMLGLLCIIVGIAGIFLPIIPGIPLMLLGFHLLHGNHVKMMQ